MGSSVLGLHYSRLCLVACISFCHTSSPMAEKYLQQLQIRDRVRSTLPPNHQKIVFASLWSVQCGPITGSRTLLHLLKVKLCHSHTSLLVFTNILCPSCRRILFSHLTDVAFGHNLFWLLKCKIPMFNYKMWHSCSTLQLAALSHSVPSLRASVWFTMLSFPSLQLLTIFQKKASQ